jgi:methyltransferase (TIGR00027 family)
MLNCSHQDESRRKVGVTALGVAYLRALESQKTSNALVKDPFAQTLAAEDGRNWVAELQLEHRQCMIDGMGIRSRKIDDEIVKFIKQGITQVCVPGAGLDCRPWRIDDYFTDDYIHQLKEVTWFELDFPEMLAHKLGTIETIKPDSCHCKKYVPVKADLSLPNWDSLFLSSSAFDTNVPTIFLLEGFTSYLTEAELTSFLTKLSAIACAGSVLIATFKTNDGGNTPLKIKYHRSYYPDPSGYMTSFGWSVCECAELNDIGKLYGRTPPLVETWSGYQILVARKI